MFKIFIASIFNSYYKNGHNKNFRIGYPFAGLVMNFTILTTSTIFLLLYEITGKRIQEALFLLIPIALLYGLLFYHWFIKEKKFFTWTAELTNRYSQEQQYRFRIISWIIIVLMFCSVIPATSIPHKMKLTEIPWRSPR